MNLPPPPPLHPPFPRRSDKTGTLTQNRMTVGNVWSNQELHEGSYYQPPPQVRLGDM